MFNQHLAQSMTPAISTFQAHAAESQEKIRVEDSVQSISMGNSNNNLHTQVPLKVFDQVDIKIPSQILEQLSTDHLLGWCTLRDALTTQLQSNDNTQDLATLVTQSAFYSNLTPFFQIKFLHSIKESNALYCR